MPTLRLDGSSVAERVERVRRALGEWGLMG